MTFLSFITEDVFDTTANSGSHNETLNIHLQQVPVHLFLQNHGLVLIQVLKGCLKFNPGERATVVDVLDLLESVVSWTFRNLGKIPDRTGNPFH